MANNALCQDCLRAQPEHPTNEGKCEACGGDTCNCKGCLATLDSLRQGERDWRRLGLRKPIKEWTEDGGVVLE